MNDKNQDAQGVHTAEPWILSEKMEDEYGIDFYIIGQGPEAHGATFVEEQIAQVWCPEHDLDANARRIVACVNKCAGLDTPLLESQPLTFKQMLANSAEQITTLTQQLEALNSTIAPLKSYFKGDAPVHEQVADEMNRLQAASHGYIQQLEALQREVVELETLVECKDSLLEQLILVVQIELGECSDIVSAIRRISATGSELQRLQAERDVAYKALVFVGHEMHATPLHMLPKGVSLFDDDGIEVRLPSGEKVKVMNCKDAFSTPTPQADEEKATSKQRRANFESWAIMHNVLDGGSYEKCAWMAWSAAIRATQADEGEKV